MKHQFLDSRETRLVSYHRRTQTQQQVLKMSHTRRSSDLRTDDMIK